MGTYTWRSVHRVARPECHSSPSRDQTMRTSTGMPGRSGMPRACHPWSALPSGQDMFMTVCVSKRLGAPYCAAPSPLAVGSAASPMESIRTCVRIRCNGCAGCAEFGCRPPVGGHQPPWGGLPRGTRAMSYDLGSAPSNIVASLRLAFAHVCVPLPNLPLLDQGRPSAGSLRSVSSLAGARCGPVLAGTRPLREIEPRCGSIPIWVVRPLETPRSRGGRLSCALFSKCLTRFSLSSVRMRLPSTWLPHVVLHVLSAGRMTQRPSVFSTEL